MAEPRNLAQLLLFPKCTLQPSCSCLAKSSPEFTSPLPLCLRVNVPKSSCQFFNECFKPKSQIGASACSLENSNCVAFYGLTSNVSKMFNLSFPFFPASKIQLLPGNSVFVFLLFSFSMAWLCSQLLEAALFENPLTVLLVQSMLRLQLPLGLTTALTPSAAGLAAP